MEQDNNEIEKSEKMEEKRTRVVRARANCLSYPVVPIGKEAKEQLMLLLERIFFQDHVWKFIEPDNGKRKTILTGFFIPKWTKYIIKRTKLFGIYQNGLLIGIISLSKEKQTPLSNKLEATFKIGSDVYEKYSNLIDKMSESTQAVLPNTECFRILFPSPAYFSEHIGQSLIEKASEISNQEQTPIYHEVYTMEQVEFLQACGFLNMGVFSIIDNQTTFTCFPLLKYYENHDTFLPPPKLHLSDPIEDIRKSMVIETGTELKCVQSVGISFEQNPRFRPTMEDEHVIIDSFAGNSNQGFFAIYDGHGGRETVEYLKNNFHLQFEKELLTNSDPEKALKETYLKVDEQVTKELALKSGSTSVTAFIKHSENGEKILYLANIGDARAVLKRGRKAERLTQDHKANDPNERERVISMGGAIFRNRLAGCLAVSRAFGDSALKNFGLSAQPHLSKTILKDTDTHLIIACDGLWDVINDQNAVDIISRQTDPQQMSSLLLIKALEAKSTDNVTIMVIAL